MLRVVLAGMVVGLVGLWLLTQQLGTPRHELATPRLPMKTVVQTVKSHHTGQQPERASRSAPQENTESLLSFAQRNGWCNSGNERPPTSLEC